jgi:hypothetical protein
VSDDVERTEKFIRERNRLLEEAARARLAHAELKRDEWRARAEAAESRASRLEAAMRYFGTKCQENTDDGEETGWNEALRRARAALAEGDEGK